MLIALLYFILFWLTGFYSWPIVHYNETLTVAGNEENKTLTLLDKIKSDEHTCHYCTKKYTTQNDIQQMIKKQQRFRDRDPDFKNLRVLFNFISIINLIMIFFIYGEPIMANTLLIFHSIGVFIFINTNNPYAIIVEYLLILLSMIIFMKIFLDLVMSIVENHTNQYKKIKYIYIYIDKIKDKIKKNFFIGG